MLSFGPFFSLHILPSLCLCECKGVKEGNELTFTVWAWAMEAKVHAFVWENSKMARQDSVCLREKRLCMIRMCTCACVWQERNLSTVVLTSLKHTWDSWRRPLFQRQQHACLHMWDDCVFVCVLKNIQVTNPHLFLSESHPLHLSSAKMPQNCL